MVTTSWTVQLLHAWQAFELAVPVFHAAALYFTLPPGRRKRDLLRQAWQWPLAGGARTLVFQLLAWALFTASLLVALPAWLAQSSGAGAADSDAAQLELLAAVAAFSAAMSLLFMCKSVLVFDPSEAATSPSRLWGRLQRGRTAMYWDVSRLPSKLAASYIVVGLGLVWTVLGFALLVASMHLSNGVDALGVAYYAGSFACFTVAAFTTHGLGGHLRYRYYHATAHERAAAGPATRRSGGSGSLSPASSESSTSDSSGGGGPNGAAGWRFYQPFRGGASFVATQALGWALHSSALALVLWGIRQAALGAAHVVRSWALAAGTTAVVAELVLAASLLTYKAGELPAGGVPAYYAAARSALSHAAVMAILYVPMHIVAASIILTFAALPPLHAAALWVFGLWVYYSATGFGGAEHTGQREWPAFQAWLGAEAERVLPAWLGSFEVVLDAGGAQFPKDKRYIFGYAPHGLYPLGAAYLPLTPSFRRLLPGVRPATLTASVVFQLPLLRDILCWAGCRAVSRATFSRTLRERGAVLMVPGGQAELVEAHRMAPARGRPAECAVYTRHRGFVRLAAREGAALVPIVALGEVSSLSNVVSLPALQRWTYRRLGFPVPFLLAGWLKAAPLPAKTGLRYVVGRPIEPPQLEPGEEPSAEQVEALHAAFYDEVERLFLRHRATFPGYEDIPLVRV